MTPQEQAEKIVADWEFADGHVLSEPYERAVLVSAISTAMTEAKKDLAEKMIDAATGVKFHVAKSPYTQAVDAMRTVCREEGIELE